MISNFKTDAYLDLNAFFIVIHPVFYVLSNFVTIAIIIFSFYV